MSFQIEEEVEELVTGRGWGYGEKRVEIQLQVSTEDEVGPNRANLVRSHLV